MSDEFIMVPREPGAEMWGGLARAIIMGRDLNFDKAHEMRRHLTRSGHDIPEWLDKELEGEKHLAKGDICAMVYKAMIWPYVKAEAMENKK